MNRRVFLGALGLSTLVAPLASEAQRAGKVARLGLLGLFTPELGGRSVAAVREGLGDLGWREGKNIQFEPRYASGNRDRLGALATELVQQRVDVIVAFGTDATRSARGATASIPIVMGGVADPVASGFVTSLARPGRNVTGVSLLQTDLVGKQLQLLRKVAPRASRIGLLSLSGPHHDLFMKEAEATARHHGVKVHRIAVAPRTSGSGHRVSRPRPAGRTRSHDSAQLPLPPTPAPPSKRKTQTPEQIAKGAIARRAKPSACLGT